jgi:hypothetical protein
MPQNESTIEVVKAEQLQDGEELHDFIGAVLKAVREKRHSSGQSLFLIGIYKGFVVTKNHESGRMFKLSMTRRDDGAVDLGDMVMVRQSFVEMKQATEKAAEQQGDLKVVQLPSCTVVIDKGKLTEDSAAILKSLAETIVEGEPETEIVKMDGGSLWEGIL